MPVKILLFMVYLSICFENGLNSRMESKTLLRQSMANRLKESESVSYMGTEESLRQNIADLIQGNLEVSDRKLLFEKDELSDTTPQNHSEYDFIVIGAGSAGATIASRLSEIPGVTVLLIEAGGKEYSIIDIPGLATGIQSNPFFTWRYETESSSKYCLANQDGKCSWTTGKAMGGSSSHNGMLAMRGDRRDYDEWANETQVDSWSYQEMLKYFEKLENVNESPEYDNKNGPVHITGIGRRPKITESFIEAGKELGFTEFGYETPEQRGFSYASNTIFKGERWSTNRAYLRPAKGRKNLILTQHSLVHKILIEETTKIACGVRYSKNGQIYEVKARKEIILTAGAIKSPQILMLSGVGPAKHLQELNINVIKDAPVGENLIDHVVYSRPLVFSVNDSSNLMIPNVLSAEDTSIKDYLRDRSGILSYGSRMNGLALVNVDDLKDTRPNVEIYHVAGDYFVTNASLSSSERVRTYWMLAILMKPLSRGKILLRSVDPSDKPKIFPNYLEHPDDVSRLVKGIRFAKKIGETNALKKHGSEFQSFSSGCDFHGIDTDEYWECELRNLTSTVYHYVGTCRMGQQNSRAAVVDSQLKVIGIDGLRVADASVMPNTVAAHTNIPAIAIGEKAADLIKQQHDYE